MREVNSHFQHHEFSTVNILISIMSLLASCNFTLTFWTFLDFWASVAHIFIPIDPFKLIHLIAHNEIF